MINFPHKIAIIGVGLIGGSIAVGLKEHFGRKITILGSCSDPQRAQLAKNKGIIDAVFPRNGRIGKDVELVIIATPVLAIQSVLKTLKTATSGDSLIMDVGSTKHSIRQLAEAVLPEKLSFVGTHPMAGKEASGFEHADPHLFRNKSWIICPTKKTRKKDLYLLKQLITILGANPIIMDPATHDEIVAWASHIFLAMADILVGAAARQNAWKMIAKIASTGFRDTTRLASHNPEMKRDIILTNKENILRALVVIREEIDKFSCVLSDGRENKLLAYLTKTKQIRDQWITTYFS